MSDPRAKRHKPNPLHLALMVDLKDALAKHPDLTAMEYLAVASQLVGNLTALQDHRRFTSDDVMAVVSMNIMEGNAAAVTTFAMGGFKL